MIYQMLPCHSTAVSMENGQWVFKSAAEIVLEVWRITNPLLDLFVIRVQEIMWVIVVCVFWWLFFFKLYQPFKIYFQGRHWKARQTKLLNDHRLHSEKEKAVIALYWPLAGSAHHPGQAPEEIINGGVSRDKVLIPVKMCCTCTLSCGRELSCKIKLEELASEVRAPCQPVICLETKFSCVAVQTQLYLDAKTADKLRKIAVRKYCSVVTVQLGRWQACCLVDGEVTPLNIDESDSSDKSNQVPVIFNSSFKADTLTVEGLNLVNASINFVKKSGDCEPLRKRCNEESGPGVAVSTGAGGLEINTYTDGLPKKGRAAEFSVIAFKKIKKDGNEVWVSSLPVRIRDDSLRTVLRDILPSAIIVCLAAKQILSSIGFATLTVAWLISFVILALTSVLPESTETTIKQLLGKVTAHVRIFYEVYWTYRYGSVHDYSKAEEEDSEYKEDADDSELDEEDIAETPDIKGKAAEDDPKIDGDPSCSVKAKAEVEAKKYFQGSRFVHSPDWQWPIYDTVYQGNESFLRLREESKGEKVDQDAKIIPFEVIYLNIKHLPWASQVQVNISSPFLKSQLPINTDHWKSCKKKVKIDGPELFRNYATLSAYRESCVAKLESPELPPDVASNNREERQHIIHLVRFMDKEFEEVKRMYAAMEAERQVTWEMLWAFLPPGERVVYVDEITDECICGEVLWTNYQMADRGPFLLVKVTKWDYNCQSWNEYTNTVTVPAFSGDRNIKSLSIRPLRLEEDPGATETSFLEHGKRFCELSMMQSNSYMKYKGSLVSYVLVDKCLRVVKENADGRVMIDLGSFSKMNPDFPLGSAKPPCEIIRDNITIPVDITQSPNRMFAPSFVYGFSFRLKKWGCFSVAGFTDIEFNDSAYDELVMNPATKTLIHSLVQERLKEGSKKEAGPQAESDRVDPIENKGDGCILLCYGPPGTGKTLTAESLSEKLQCPLWCLSVFELGVTPAALETMLVKVLDVAASWGAILLLDEADVYLERRSSKDLVRNSMTGVFLRHLEYYRGVLFLTTNRDAAFDEAICSRITMFLYYGRHDECQRSAIWKTLFRRLCVDCTSETLAEFSKPDFNGREITKIVKTAQTLAKSMDERLGFQHVRDALEVYEESSKLRTSLNSSTGASSLPAHQQLTAKQLLEIFSTSAPPELHPSSKVTSADVVQDERPLDLNFSSNVSEETIGETRTGEFNGTETPTSDQCNETIEAVTLPSETCSETIHTVTPTSDQCNGTIEAVTPTSKCNETIEAATPASSSKTINNATTAPDYYLS